MDEFEIKQVLWVVPKFPLPAEDGSRIATLSLLQTLPGLGYEIDLVYFGEDSTQARKDLALIPVRSIFNIPHTPRTADDLLEVFRRVLKNPTVPVTLSPFLESARKCREFNEIINSKKWDLLVYDSLHGAAHLIKDSCISAREELIVYRAHNCESEIWQRKSMQEKNAFKKILLKWQTALISRFERLLCKRSNAIVTVSEKDRSSLGSLDKSISVPVGFKREKIASLKTEPNLLFIGQLDWPPNRDGLEWFLEQVWPAAKKARPELNLTIAGSGDGAYLEKFKSLDSVTVLGRVRDLAPLYARASLTLAPIFYGSGTRVKIIESALYGVPCLSTTIGTEGLNLENGQDCFISDASKGWIEILSKLSLAQSDEFGKRAEKKLAVEHDPIRCAQKFQTFISEISARPQNRES